jgi:putative acetyltransferase
MNDAETSSPRPEWLLRAVQPKDADGVADLVNLPGFRWGTLRLPYQTPEQVGRWIEKAGPDMVSLVAVAGGRIIGSAALDRKAGRRAHVGGIGMGVHDAWTGRGVGSALLAALLETADQWLGLRRVELTVWTDNPAALALYRRFGFVVEGTHRQYGFRDGVYVDSHAMARLRS